MTRAALALAALLTLSLNGSIVVAATPHCGTGVCALSLRMMAPPPPRPATLVAPAAQQAMVIPAALTR